MRFSENWLRTFVDPGLSTRELANAVTMSGIEVETIEPAAPPFEGVVVGEVLTVEKHPDAERLTVCRVAAGGEPLAIVCGAPNVRAGLKVPTALVGARLPQMAIRKAKVRGVESHGMLCSASELGLAADAAGLLVLPEAAPVGADLRTVLDLDDQLLTIKPTPNRGDCLSLLGIAREVAAVCGAPLKRTEVKPVVSALAEALPVVLDAPEACPRYCGRLIRNVNAKAPTPSWIAARLERSGLRSISAIVDITNYVMLELGQPLHAFDASRLEGGIRVRFARAGEPLTLLNDKALELASDFLVIADERKAVALAGIMGGAASAVGEDTRDIFLESAFFAPEAIAGKTRRLGFGSDSAYRFERGVDFAATRTALERASALVLEICGGAAGPVSEACARLPQREPVPLRVARVARVLGVSLDADAVRGILERLGFDCTMTAAGLTARAPAYRFDIAIEEDLIEEVARIHGYENIPAAAPAAPASMLPVRDAGRDAAAARRLLAARDYQEIITYSFVDREWEADFCGNAQPIALANPIASQMSVMRSSLLGSLVNAVAFNENYRQSRVRLFEIGRCFERDVGAGYVQPMRIGGVAYGEALAEQWGVPGRTADFYDVKADVEALLGRGAARFDPAPHPALHPGKSARIVGAGGPLGWIGELHPRLQRKYDLRLAPVVFELDFERAMGGEVPLYREISRFPPVRRDLAIVVDEAAPYEAILDTLERARPPIVTEIGVFDVYRGPGVEKGKKSLAFRVLLQDTQKTLTDAEVEAAMALLVQTLQQRFDARLR